MSKSRTDPGSVWVLCSIGVDDSRQFKSVFGTVRDRGPDVQKRILLQGSLNQSPKVMSFLTLVTAAQVVFETESCFNVTTKIASSSAWTALEARV